MIILKNDYTLHGLNFNYKDEERISKTISNYVLKNFGHQVMEQKIKEFIYRSGLPPSLKILAINISQLYNSSTADMSSSHPVGKYPPQQHGNQSSIEGTLDGDSTVEEQAPQPFCSDDFNANEPDSSPIKRLIIEDECVVTETFSIVYRSNNILSFYIWTDF